MVTTTAAEYGSRVKPGTTAVSRSKQPLADHFLDGGEFLIGLVELGLGGLCAELGGERVIFGGDDAILRPREGLGHVLELAVQFIDDVVAGAHGGVALLFGE